MKEDKGNIIFVDDDIDENDPYVEHAKLVGYKVEVVQNPERLFSLLKESKWDVIVLDIMFPRGDMFSMEDSLDNRRTGVLILNEIANTMNDFDIGKRIIVRTAVTNNLELREDCYALGILENNYFEKPGDLVKLFDAIERATEAD